LKKLTFTIGVIAFAAGILTTLLLALFFNLSSSFFSSIFPVSVFLPVSSYCAESVSPVFSPSSEDYLVSLITGSNASIDVMLYQFSNAKLKNALLAAVARGVQVRLILEPKVDSNLETGVFLAARGVQVRWASQKYYNTHAKFAVFDEACVFVGSTNWSRTAFELNREAAVKVCSRQVASEFEKVFENDWMTATAVIA